MTPESSKARTRRQQGAADKPTRCANSALVNRPLRCSSFNMAQSNLSIVSKTTLFKQYSFKS
jgi:hypothetical protein